MGNTARKQEVMAHPELVRIKRALISVSDKTGLEEFAQKLAQMKIEILSTGGTAKMLRDLKIPVKDVSEETGFPEIMDGRVKTLHPKIHGALLGLRDEKTHKAQMEEHGIAPIDLLIVNLYPFAETVKKGGDYNDCVENIDIGGPAMIRAAAKNHGYVAVITDTGAYEELLTELKTNQGSTGFAFRQKMAARAYAHTSSYDSMVANWFNFARNETLPQTLLISGEQKEVLRYGENAHQTAAVYTAPFVAPGIVQAKQIQGKELSYNNYNDADAALELVREFAQPAVAIIKHANPCGVAIGKDLVEAYARAYACDTVSAFGGVIAVNRKLDKKTAEAITQIFTEVVIAPDADEDAKAVFAKKTNLRLLLLPDHVAADREGFMVKSISGGYLLQTRDNKQVQASELKIVTERQPSSQEIQDMLFAFTVAKHVKSNAIVYAKGNSTVGIGAGQMSRVDSTRIAKIKAQDMKLDLKGSVAASDAFFPFADGIETIASAGATSVIQPGGSVRDNEVIEAANKLGLAMVFTGFRHFRH